MAGKPIKAAVEGWFTLDQDNPKLLGNQCVSCGTYYFPQHSNYCRNPECESEEFNTIELSSKGRIWSYSNAEYPPPEPFVASDPHEVFAVAAVELEKEKLIILGQLVKGVTVDDVSIGTEVELTLETLFEDDEHNHIVWKWKPLAGGEA